MIEMDLKSLVEKRGFKAIGDVLKRAAGDPSEKLSDDAWYRRMVIDPAWDAATLPFQMVGRDALRWDEFFRELKPEAYATAGGRISLRRDWEEGLGRVLARFGPPPIAFDPRPAPPTRVDSSPPPVSLHKSPTPKSPTKSLFDDENNENDAESLIFSDVIREIVPMAELVEEDDPNEPATAVGIDLGTTYSVVAYVDRQGRPASLVNSNGDLLTPSVVLFEGEEVIVGKEAVAAAILEPANVADCVKRDMGGKAYRKPIKGESVPPEVISSLILKKLKADAERKLGRIREAVITVPAYFDEPRRQATATAGELAGLKVIDIINEPTAAAIAYGHQIGMIDGNGVAGDPRKVLVYDLGGGTFDVTIVELHGQKFRAIATDGDVYLGGKDWDEQLIAIAAERFKAKHRDDPRQNPHTLQELSQAAEACKKTLSERPKGSIVINHLGVREKIEITRDEFETATEALLARTQITTEIVIQQAGLGWDQIDRILLVGGSTRMPAVPRMLKQLSGKTPDSTVSADEAVAHGAALYADMLLKKQGRGEAQARQSEDRFSITNINSHSLGLVGVDPRTKERFNEIIIPKNTPLPHTVVRRFRTLKPDQQSVRIRVLEGENEFPSACTHVGDCVIRNLPTGLPAGWPVEVRYAYEQNGRLAVSGKLVGHEASITTEFRRENVMEDSEVVFWAKVVANRNPS